MNLIELYDGWLENISFVPDMKFIPAAKHLLKTNRHFCGISIGVFVAF